MRPRDRRALVSGAVVVAILWIGLSGVPAALESIQTLETRTAQASIRLAMTEKKVGGLSTLGDSIATLERVVTALPDALLAGDDGNSAAIDLVGRVRSVLGGRRLRLEGIGPPGVPVEAGALSLLSVPVRIRTDFPGLIAAVDALDRDPALSVEGVTVEANTPHATASEPEDLRVDIVVAAWFSSPTGRSPDARGRDER